MVSSGPAGKSVFVSGLVPSWRGWKTNHGSRRGVHCGAVCRCSGTERWQKKRGVALVSADTPGCPRFRRHRRTPPRSTASRRRLTNLQLHALQLQVTFRCEHEHAVVHACLSLSPLPPPTCNQTIHPGWKFVEGEEIRKEA